MQNYSDNHCAANGLEMQFQQAHFQRKRFLHVRV